MLTVTRCLSEPKRRVLPSVASSWCWHNHLATATSELMKELMRGPRCRPRCSWFLRIHVTADVSRARNWPGSSSYFHLGCVAILLCRHLCNLCRHDCGGPSNPQRWLPNDRGNELLFNLLSTYGSYVLGRLGGGHVVLLLLLFLLLLLALVLLLLALVLDRILGFEFKKSRDDVGIVCSAMFFNAHVLHWLEQRDGIAVSNAHVFTFTHERVVHVCAVAGEILKPPRLRFVE